MDYTVLRITQQRMRETDLEKATPAPLVRYLIGVVM